MHVCNVTFGQCCVSDVTFCSLDDDDDSGDDVNNTDSTNGIIIGVTLGVVFTIISIITIMCIVKKKLKKVSQQDSIQSSTLEPPANNSSHLNTGHTEVPHISTSAETTFTTSTLDTSKPSPYNRSYQPPANNLSDTPDDVPPYPPPDYAFARNYTLPDYTCTVSSDKVTTK